ncbi:MAG: AMP-binding enzyme, partial [Crocinitomicaceae bacterium]
VVAALGHLKQAVDHAGEAGSGLEVAEQGRWHPVAARVPLDEGVVAEAHRGEAAGGQVAAMSLDEHKKEIEDNSGTGNLCIKRAWPSIARTIYGDHQRYIDTYFSAYPGYYFTGDGALRDENGNYRITGRVDDVIIVSGHNLGTAPIEDAINEHPLVAESAIVGFPHDIKGNALYGFVTLKNENPNEVELKKEINQYIADAIGPIAKLDKIQFTSGLPKTRSGKIMRRILRKIAEGDFSNFGDISTLLNPEIVEEIKNGKQ